MAKYANKTCYDCAVIKPANQMYRVTESYNSGRSDRRPDAANVAGFIFSDAKTSRNMIKGALTKNNRRKYTRNRTVWKCGSCSGHDASVRQVQVQKVKEQPMTTKEMTSGFMHLFTFLFMLASGAMTGFLVFAMTVFAATGEIDGLLTAGVLTCFFAPLFALSYYKFKK